MEPTQGDGCAKFELVVTARGCMADGTCCRMSPGGDQYLANGMAAAHNRASSNLTHFNCILFPRRRCCTAGLPEERLWRRTCRKASGSRDTSTDLLISIRLRISSVCSARTCLHFKVKSARAVTKSCPAWSGRLIRPMHWPLLKSFSISSDAQ